MIKEISESTYHVFWKDNKGSIFNDSKWLNLVVSTEEKITYFGLFENENIINAFPLVIKKGRFFQYITTPKLTMFLGFVKEGDYKLILSHIKKYNSISTNYPVPKLLKGEKTNVTHKIDLTQAEEVLHKALRSDKKRNIKGAKKQNLTLRIENDFLLLQDLIKKTFERQQHDFNGYEQIHRIIKSYPNQYQVSVWDEGTCLASLLIVHDTQTAYYLIGGFDNSQKNYNAGPFAMWSAILHAKSLGLTVFDFEGSSVPSIAKYFQSFGAVKVEYSVFKNGKWWFKLLQKVRK